MRGVRDLAAHYHKGPDLITDDEIKDYLVHLAQERKLARSSVNVAVNGMRCFFNLVLKRDCEHLKGIIPRCQRAIRRPRVYSVEELESSKTAADFALMMRSWLERTGRLNGSR